MEYPRLTPNASNPQAICLPVMCNNPPWSWLSEILRAFTLTNQNRVRARYLEASELLSSTPASGAVTRSIVPARFSVHMIALLGDTAIGSQAAPAEVVAALTAWTTTSANWEALMRDIRLTSHMVTSSLLLDSRTTPFTGTDLSGFLQDF